MTKVNEKGQALVIVLFFSAIALLIIGAVLYMVLRGQTMSGIGKQYQSSLDAGYAGVGIGTGFLDSGTSYLITSPALTLYSEQGTSHATVNVDTTSGSLSIDNADACLTAKLYTTRPAGSANWAACPTAGEGGGLSIDASINPDLVYSVNGINTTYFVYTKIVDSRSGITASRPPGGLAEMKGYVSKTSSAQGLDVQPQAYFYYTVEVLARNEKTSGSYKEVAKISYDYAY